MSALPDPRDSRTPDHPIEELFILRWSPRSFSDQELTEQELNSLFEAARWAPSTYNEQEWRYLYARREGEHWETFFNLLVEGNKAWCHRAAVLVVVCSKETFTKNGKPNPVHTFDSGLASENLMLQAAAMGIIAHGMAGFDRDRARRDLEIPDDYDPEAMIAIGHPGDPDDLPENLRGGEQPSGRKKIDEFVREGRFSF